MDSQGLIVGTSFSGMPMEDTSSRTAKREVKHWCGFTDATVSGVARCASSGIACLVQGTDGDKKFGDSSEPRSCVRHDA